MDLVEVGLRGGAPAVRHPWEFARAEVVGRLIGRHRALPAGAVVLDVGCGDTFVVEQLAQQHPQALFYAVDTAFTDEQICQYRERFQTRNVCVSPSLDAIAPSIGKVSLILLMDVLEHIADDGAFLADLLARSWIEPGVQLLATVPAYQSLFCSHDTVLGHHRRYSIGRLRNLLRDSGLSVVDSGYFFFSLLPVRALEVLKERLLDGNGAGTTGLVTWRGGRAKTSLLKNLLVIDATIGSSLARRGVIVPGLSTYAVCRISA